MNIRTYVTKTTVCELVCMRDYSLVHMRACVLVGKCTYAFLNVRILYYDE